MTEGSAKRERTTALRKLSMYGFDLVAGGHNLYALLEFDITDLRARLREERRGGGGGSLFAFILKAIGRCLAEHPEFNSIINLRHTTTFGRVDVNIPVEVESGGKPITKQYIVRDINGKSLKTVTDEIAESKKNVNDEKGYVFSGFAQKLLCALPRFVVLGFMRSLLKNHERVMKLSGSVFVTSVSMFSNAPGYIIPYTGGPKGCSFAVGSAVKKPVVVAGEIVIREMLNITAVFNHDIIDGAPAARFIDDLRSFIEKRPEEILRF